MKNFTKKWIVLPLAFLAITLPQISCSGDDAESTDPAYVCETCADMPDALAANDQSIKGVYKGIFIGSTGTIFIDIQNGSNVITATMVLDGQSIELTSTAEIIDGEPFVAPFTGMYNGSSISITFSVGLNGADPIVVTSDIPGHPNAVFEVHKETSTSLIEAFEGSYTRTGGETGAFNILMARSLSVWGGVARETGGAETNEVNGTINSNDQLLNEQGIVMGAVEGDEINGTFQDGEGATVNITGQRTL